MLVTSRTNFKTKGKYGLYLWPVSISISKLNKLHLFAPDNASRMSFLAETVSLTLLFILTRRQHVWRCSQGCPRLRTLKDTPGFCPEALASAVGLGRLGGGKSELVLAPSYTLSPSTYGLPGSSVQALR